MVPRENNRQLPNNFVRLYLEAIAAETGLHTLRMLLRNAGLERYIEAFPPDNRQQETLASEFAALQGAIRSYFGKGARGSLNRIGRVAWENMLKNASLPARTGLGISKALPIMQKSQRALKFLAKNMQAPDGQVSVHLLDRDLIFVDASSDSTHGQQADQPVCWATLGAIQGALLWASGAEQGVDEISCRAMGADACKFRISLLAQD